MHFSSILPITLGLSLSALAHPTQKLSTRATGRTSAPSGCLTVGGSSGKYSTISSALEALGSSTEDACIFVNSGTYKEQFRVEYGGALTLYGYTEDTSSYASNAVTITNSISSPDAGSLDESSTVNVVADGFKMYNINIENGYGEGAQAVAVTANADKLSFYGCSFTSYQDTLYAKAGTQFYTNSYITGAVDYVFGNAALWITASTIASNGAGSITAMSREDSDDTSYYVIDSSSIGAADDANADLTGKVFLGRPWRAYARVQVQNSELSDVVNEEGWTTMADNAEPVYTEYNNSGDGSDTSARKYGTEASSAVEIATVLGSDYADWVDATY
ncbi:pectinesterase family protein [Phyllosticta citrichinensis]|uniref:Pectinesterase n=1 Tax=Phyllosticta citrichinensis TaxID=1130410 RepID=A0ABR1XLB5_9PEZI